LRARYPVRICETAKDLMLPLDPRQIWIPVSNCGHGIARALNAKNISQTEVRPPLISICVHTRLKRREQRSARAHVIPHLPALLVTQKRDVRQNDGSILMQNLCPKIVIMDKVERKTAFDQGIVHSLHVLRDITSSGA